MKTFAIDWSGHDRLEARAPNGAQVAGRWQSPFDADELRELVETALCFSPPVGPEAAFRGAEVELGEFDPKDVGQRLFGALFAGAVLELLQRCRGALAPGEGLRLELSFDLEDREQRRLYSLPWELMHDGRGFLAWAGLQIVRRPRVDRQEAKAPLPIERLRILAAVLSSAHLDVARELDLLAKVGERRPQFEFELAEPGGLADLRRRLEEGGFHGLHLIGHGRWDDESREFGLDSPDGFLSSSHLAVQLGQHLPLLRLVVLNSCRSGRLLVGERGGAEQVAAGAGVATALVAAGAVAVIAMQAPISDQAASRIPFAIYQRLARDGSLAAAVGEARLDLHDASRAGVQPFEWAVPVQLERSQGPLFFFPAVSAPAAPVLSRLGIVALAGGSAGLLGLIFQLALFLAHPPELAKVAAGAAGLGAILLQRALGGRRLWATLAGLLAKGGRQLAIGLLLPAAAGVLWLSTGADRLHQLPCLAAAPPRTDPRLLLGLDLDGSWDPFFRREVRDLAVRLGFQPLDLGSGAAAGLPLGCFSFRIAGDPAAGPATASLVVHRGASPLAAIEEPWGDDRQVTQAYLLRRLDGLLSRPDAPPAAGLDPQSPSYRANADALRVYAEGDLGGAIAILREAVRQDGDEPVLRNNLAQLLAGLGEQRRLQAGLLPAREREARERLLAAADGAFAEARLNLDQALLASPGQPIYTYNRGRLRQLQGQPDAAAADFAAALAAWPAFPEAANELAVLELEAGRPRAARKRLELALRWAGQGEPGTRAALRKNLGRALQEEGELSAAAASFEEALELASPESDGLRAEALSRLAAVHGRLLGPATACVTWRRYAAASLPQEDSDPSRREAFAAAAERCAGLYRRR